MAFSSTFPLGRGGSNPAEFFSQSVVLQLKWWGGELWVRTASAGIASAIAKVWGTAVPEPRSTGLTQGVGTTLFTLGHPSLAYIYPEEPCF